MLTWLKGKITRMVIETKVHQLTKLMTQYAEFIRKPISSAFLIGAKEGLEVVPSIMDKLTADEVRLVRIAETWLPVLESAKIALDLSSDDLKSIMTDIVSCVEKVSKIDIPEEINAEANKLAAEIEQSGKELLQ